MRFDYAQCQSIEAASHPPIDVVAVVAIFSLPVGNPIRVPRVTRVQKRFLGSGTRVTGDSQSFSHFPFAADITMSKPFQYLQPGQLIDFPASGMGVVIKVDEKNPHMITVREFQGTLRKDQRVVAGTRKVNLKNVSSIRFVFEEEFVGIMQEAGQKLNNVSKWKDSVEIRSAGEKGVGLFAKKKLAKGFMLPYLRFPSTRGVALNHGTFNVRTQDEEQFYASAHTADFGAFANDGSVYLDEGDVCEAYTSKCNAMLVEVPFSERPSLYTQSCDSYCPVFLQMLRDINEGEEILTNYGATFWDGPRIIDICTPSPLQNAREQEAHVESPLRQPDFQQEEEDVKPSVEELQTPADIEEGVPLVPLATPLPDLTVELLDGFSASPVLKRKRSYDSFPGSGSGSGSGSGISNSSSSGSSGNSSGSASLRGQSRPCLVLPSGTTEISDDTSSAAGTMRYEGSETDSERASVYGGLYMEEHPLPTPPPDAIIFRTQKEVPPLKTRMKMIIDLSHGRSVRDVVTSSLTISLMDIAYLHAYGYITLMCPVVVQMPSSSGIHFG